MTLFTYNLIVQVILAGRGKNSNPLLVQKVLHACTHSLYKYHCYMQVMKDHKNCHGSPPLDLWYPLFSWHTWLFSSERVVLGQKQESSLNLLSKATFFRVLNYQVLKFNLKSEVPHYTFR